LVTAGAAGLFTAGAAGFASAGGVTFTAPTGAVVGVVAAAGAGVAGAAGVTAAAGGAVKSLSAFVPLFFFAISEASTTVMMNRPAASQPVPFCSTLVVCTPKAALVTPSPKAAPRPSWRGRCMRMIRMRSRQTSTSRTVSDKIRKSIKWTVSMEADVKMARAGFGGAKCSVCWFFVIGFGPSSLPNQERRTRSPIPNPFAAAAPPRTSTRPWPRTHSGMPPSPPWGCAPGSRSARQSCASCQDPRHP